MNHKIITPTEEVCDQAWNKSLPIPLTKGEKIIVENDQSGVSENYLRVKHGVKGDKVISVFAIRNFTTLKGLPL